MRILVISSVLPPFKAAEADYALQLCQRLSALGHSLTVISSQRKNLPEIPGTVVRAVMGKWTWRELPRLMREIRKARPEGIVLLYLGWMYSYHPMITFLPVFARWLAPHVRTITLFYNRYGARREEATLPRLLLHKVFKKISGDRSLIYEYGSLLSHSDRVFALSRPHESVFMTVDPRVQGRLDRLPALPLLPFFPGGSASGRENGRRLLGLTAEEKALVFFGYPYPSKGLETLFAAVKRLREHGQPVRLFIVGGMMDPQALPLVEYVAGLQKLAKDLGIEPVLTWTGDFEAGSDRPSQLLYAADAVVLPFDNGVSLNNSSFATAAGHEAAIVSCRPAELEPEFIHRENCFLCSPRDPAALADAIACILNDRELAQKIGRGAGQLARQTFAWDKAARRLSQALEPSP